MVASTHSTGDLRPFREWLAAEMAKYNWSQAEVGRRIDMGKSTVGKWLMEDGHPSQRRPSYEACKRLATLFGVDLRRVLTLAGITEDERNEHLTDLQRDVQAQVALIPDPALIVIRPMLQSLIDARTQQLVIEKISAACQPRAARRTRRQPRQSIPTRH
jgi:transcriptional regulator with XRE-family HTH domain